MALWVRQIFICVVFITLLADPSLKKTKWRKRYLKRPILTRGILRAETKGTQGYVEVLISGTPERLSMRYLRGLQEAMTEYWQGRKGKKPSVLSEMAFSALGEVSVSELVELTKSCQIASSQGRLPRHDDSVR